MSPVEPFNPLDKKNLGASVADALLATPLTAFTALEKFEGAGVYAVYYNGSFKAYRPLTQRNTSAREFPPIYVGKAIPPGARKGGVGIDQQTNYSLFSRLCEHAESIKAVNNLRIQDFFYRSLVVDDIWIPLGESLLIARFAPVWNTLVDGFGNHDPGSGRYKGLRPRWDVIHPGRSWAEKCAARPETASQILNDIAEYFRTHS